MSNEVMTLCQKRIFGSATKKAVIMYMADRASDDGSGVWTSKARIARETELSKRSVQNSIKEFEAQGIISEVGHKKCDNGFTNVYQINLAAVKRLDLAADETSKTTRAGDSPVQGVHPTRAGDSPHGVQEIHPTRASGAPKPSLNHPSTLHEPTIAREDLLSGIDDQETVVRMPSKREQETALEQEFEEVWIHYPRKTGKDAALKAWLKARKKATREQILPALGAFIRTIKGTDTQYIVHFSRWLNEGRWKDDQTHARNAAMTTDQRLDSLMQGGDAPQVTSDDRLNNLFPQGSQSFLEHQKGGA